MGKEAADLDSKGISFERFFSILKVKKREIVKQNLFFGSKTIDASFMFK